MEVVTRDDIKEATTSTRRQRKLVLLIPKYEMLIFIINYYALIIEHAVVHNNG